jgi:septal ring factor EnvC (AmiA/AmiB activator)
LREQAEEEERLTRLLTEKKSLTNSARQELAEQGARAAELAAKAGNLGKLIETLESEISSVRQAAEAARRAEEHRRSEEEKRLAEVPGGVAMPDFSDTSRIAPAVEFEKAKGLLPLPAGGVEVRSFGSRNALGEKSPGIAIATRINARVVSPADGWVVYSGPFRSYGQLLILNAGNGYHVVMSGMEKIDVELGQFVLAGEPVAVMGARRVASAEAVGMETSRPVLYVEFRKDGTSIDPSPWWADSSSERVTDDS